MNNTNAVFATPQNIDSLNECDFYHTMEIPGYPIVYGHWDLRKGIQKYLGNVLFENKRVLEVGTADGFICFYMEKQGAEVVALDLCEEHSFDMVPYSRCNYSLDIKNIKNHIRRINNGYWLAHKAFQSQAKVVYSSVYDIPEEIGGFDISTICAVLLHLKNPFQAIENILKLTKETVIICDVPPKYCYYKPYFLRAAINSLIPLTKGKRKPFITFLPDFNKCQPKDTWWNISPEFIVRYIGMLGFEKSVIKYHLQKYKGKHKGRYSLFYTIVGHRTNKLVT